MHRSVSAQHAINTLDSLTDFLSITEFHFTGAQGNATLEIRQRPPWSYVFLQYSRRLLRTTTCADRLNSATQPAPRKELGCHGTAAT